MKFKPKYICDRCNAQMYKKSYINVRLFQQSPVNFKDVFVNWRYDLCENCMGELQQFLDVHKNEEKQIGFKD